MEQNGSSSLLTYISHSIIERNRIENSDFCSYTKNTLSIKLFKKSLGIVTNILCIIDDITNI